MIILNILPLYAHSLISAILLCRVGKVHIACNNVQLCMDRVEIEAVFICLQETLKLEKVGLLQ